MTVLWVLLGILYLVVLITLGVATLRKGHFVLFIVGFFIPLLWLVGGLIGPTPRAAGAQ
jgi:ABC-type multidrug transport system permease subunit